MPLWRRITTAAPVARASRRVDRAIECGRLNEQADHDERFAREIEEVSRMHEHIVLVEQLEDQRLFGAKLRDLEHGRPAAFDSQHVD